MRAKRPVPAIFWEARMSPYFSIKYIPDGRIVRVVFAGRLGLAERIAAAQQVTEKYHHHSPLRLLVDLRHQEAVLTPEEQRQLAGFVCDDPVLQKAHIAILHRHDYSATALVSGLITRHLSNARQFLVESEALGWLRERRPVTG